MLIGCEVPKSNEPKQPKVKTNYEIVIIDGCEYIEHDEGFMDNHVYSLTHKGIVKTLSMSIIDNCPYCHTWVPPDNPEQCAEKVYDSSSLIGWWYCTREKGHSGPHIACQHPQNIHNLSNVEIILTFKFDNHV